MKVNAFNVNVNSAEPEKLIAFYADIVGLPRRPEIGPGAFIAGTAAGVKFVRPPTREPWGGLVATFVDLDGNYCQLVRYS